MIGGDFFVKQKTAYGMRIIDWSSDVCSSDLMGRAYRPVLLAGVMFMGLGAAAPAPAAGDAIRGKAIYSRYLACHALAYDRTGPRHCGLFGRKAGSEIGRAHV